MKRRVLLRQQQRQHCLCPHHLQHSKKGHSSAQSNLATGKLRLAVPGGQTDGPTLPTQGTTAGPPPIIL